MTTKLDEKLKNIIKIMNLKIEHGLGKDSSERQKLLSECSYALCVGGWQNDSDAEQQYRMAVALGKPVLEMRYEAQIPLKEIIRYLQPVRPIKDTIAGMKQSKTIY